MNDKRDGWDPEDSRLWIGRCSTREPCPDNGMGYRFHGVDCQWRGVTPTPAEVASATAPHRMDERGLS